VSISPSMAKALLSARAISIEATIS